MSTNSGNPLLNDQALAVARAAIAELADGDIGKHVGVSGMGANVVTHCFAADEPGYPGWEWHAVLACAAGSDDVTVNEVALVPGTQALQAPEWVPYSQRVRPGDLGPGDLMPPEPGDERLDADGNLSAEGLRQARERWRTGDFGPNSEMAAAAPLQCRTCAFLLPLPAAEPPRAGQGSEAEGRAASFGVCTNALSADGHVVHATYGCGAHSKTHVDSDIEKASGAFDDEMPIF